eukprot:1714258-Heterocapsa_arctica.AAC.1
MNREVGPQGDPTGPGSDPKETSQAPGPGPPQGVGRGHHRAWVSNGTPKLKHRASELTQKNITTNTQSLRADT